MSFTVHVEYDDGSNASNIKVSIDLGLFNGMMTSYTNNNGDANFNIDLDGPKTITFYAKGNQYQTETVRDGECVYITL